jgi:hypothetical protein
VTSEAVDAGNPTLSVLFCVHKDMPFLNAAIDSVLRQTYSNFEFLIGADSKAPGLVERLHALCGGDPRVKIYSINIPQLQFSLNFLANFSKGDYLLRMDGDDVCELDRFQVQVDAINARQADILASWVTLIDHKDRVLGVFEPPTDPKSIKRRMVYATVIYHPTVAMKRDFFMAMRGYAGGVFSEDYDLWLRALRAGASIEIIPRHLLRYRIHPGQATGTRVGRAEQVGHQMRELLLSPGFGRFAAFCVALSKSLFGPGFTTRARQTILGRSGGTIEKLT